MSRHALLIVFIIFNLGLAFAISGIFGTFESFANTIFCKKFQCDLTERDDNFYGVSSRYEYLLKSFNGDKTVNSVSVRIIRDIDKISESILFIDTDTFSSKFYAVVSEFTLAIINKKFTASEIQGECGSNLNKEAKPKNILFEQTSNLFVYCGFVESKSRVKITSELHPTVRFDDLTQYKYLKSGTQDKEDDGFSVKPEKGDILVLGTATYGHVAIVAEVTDTSVKVAQQNVVKDGFTSNYKIEKLPNGK
jgi:hypothetical protein